MHVFKNILVIADGEDQQNAAFERAARLALRNHARLTVACIAEPLPNIQYPVVARHSADLCEKRVREMMMLDDMARLVRLIAPLRDAGLDVETRILRGTPFVEIIREVLRTQNDLVMITAADEPGLKSALFGDTSTHLLHKCPCPVWILKPPRNRFYNRILTAVDPHDPDREHQELNFKIMELAASLAHSEQSEIYVVHSWIPPGILGSEYWRNGVEQVASDIRQAHVACLDELLRVCPLENVRYQVHLLEGAPAKVIAAMARRKRVDVIVMGTVCRTGVAGLFLGNTAEKVLRQVDCSILTVKPDAFVTSLRIDELERVHAA